MARATSQAKLQKAGKEMDKKMSLQTTEENSQGWYILHLYYTILVYHLFCLGFLAYSDIPLLQTQLSSLLLFILHVFEVVNFNSF